MTKRYKAVTKRSPANKIRLNLDLARELSNIQCTENEIAIILGCSPRTLRNSKEFMKIHAEGREHGKQSLRRLQWQKAQGREAILARDDEGKLLFDDKGKPVVLMPGNAPDTVMQIWLGKQYLEQRDKRESEHTGTVGIKIISGVPRPRITEIKPILLAESTEQPPKEQQ